MFQLYGLHFNSIYDALNFGKGSFEYIQYTLEYQTYIMHRKLSATLIPYLRTIRKLEKQACLLQNYSACLCLTTSSQRCGAKSEAMPST